MTLLNLGERIDETYNIAITASSRLGSTGVNSFSILGCPFHEKKCEGTHLRGRNGLPLSLFM